MDHQVQPSHDFSAARPIQPQPRLAHVAPKGCDLARKRQGAIPRPGRLRPAVVAVHCRAAVKHRNDGVTAFGQGAGQFAAEQAAGAGDEDAQQITRHQRTIRLAPYAPPRHPIGTKTPRPRFSTRLGRLGEIDMIKVLPPPREAEEHRNTAEILRDLAAQVQFGSTRNELVNLADNLDRLAAHAERRGCGCVDPTTYERSCNRQSAENPATGVAG